jgi:hypothetical protein
VLKGRNFITLLIGVSIGNLITSILFYAKYDQHMPMVMSALTNAVVLIGIMLHRFLEET